MGRVGWQGLPFFGFERLEQVQAFWASPSSLDALVCCGLVVVEEVVELLGIPRTKGEFHHRRLSRLVERGILKKVRVGKTPYYWKDELRAVASKVAEGGHLCVNVLSEITKEPSP